MLREMASGIFTRLTLWTHAGRRGSRLRYRGMTISSIVEFSLFAVTERTLDRR